MDGAINEHDNVVESIVKANEPRFTVLSNVGKDEHYIAQLFPDVILIDKTTEKPVFIIEVKKNGNIAQCIQQWKAVPSIPATIYIVVPENDLSNAKAIAQVVGLNTRFGTYSLDEKGIPSVKFL